MKTVFSIMEAVTILDRAGRNCSTSAIAKVAGMSYVRAKKMLVELESTAVVWAVSEKHRPNSVSIKWQLTSSGIAIHDAYQRAAMNMLPF